MMKPVDYLFAFGRIVTSFVEGPRKSVLVNVGAGSENTAGDFQGTSEGSTREPLYGQLGVVARPESPTAEGYAEALLVRFEDGLTPIAARDLRLSALVDVDVGGMAFVQYGGGFLGLSYAQTTPTKAGTKARLYAPSGTGQAHELVLDPAGPTPTIKLSHLGGHYVELTPTAIVIGNASAQALPYADPLLEFIGLVKKCLLAPAANGAPPTTALSPLELATFSAYPNLVASKTTILRGT